MTLEFRRLAVCLLAIQLGLGLTGVAAAHPDRPSPADVIIENVNVVPMTDEIVLTDRSVVVRDGMIIAIIEPEGADRFVAAQTIDGGGHYLLPGLADMHVHMRMDPASFFALQLANGVTTVHNMGTGDSNGAQKLDHLALRQQVATGQIEGPRYLVSGPQLHAAQLPDLAAVETVLDDHVRLGYDTLKVHGDLAPDIYNALIIGAHARGIRVTGHAQHMLPLAQTLRMDALEHMEEFLYMSRDGAFAEQAQGDVDNFLEAYRANILRLENEEYRHGLVQEVAASGIVLDPTLVIYTTLPRYISDERFASYGRDPLIAHLPPRIQQDYLDPEANEYRAGLAKLFRNFLDRVGDDTPVADHLDHNIALMKTLLVELHSAGVPMLLGSDAFGLLVPGFAAHEELELLVSAGLSPYEALQTATVNVASYLGEEPMAGTIEPGKRADFILVEGNPLDDISNANSVRGVFTRQRWYSEMKLQHMLANVISKQK